MPLYIPRLEQGSYRDICPSCGRDSTLSVTVTRTKALWFCHRAACGFKGIQGGSNLGVGQKAQDEVDFDNYIPSNSLYIPYPVKDNDMVVRGYVSHAIDKTTKPKRLLRKSESWCGLAFVRKIIGKEVLLVEDILSARAMSPHYPTVALLGVHLNYAKVDYLYSIGVTKAHIALDNDATLQAIKTKRLHCLIDRVILLQRDLKDETEEKLIEIAESL